MKLKAFALTAGLLAFGVTNAAWAKYPTCTTNLDGQVRNSGSKCTSKSYKFNADGRCTCPGDKPQQTKKCAAEVSPEYFTAQQVYSCEVP